MAASNGPKTSKSLLLNEQIQQLIAQFTTLRTMFSCPNYPYKHAIYKSGALATEPPQPQYVCKNCGKSYSSHAIADTIANASTSPDTDSLSTRDDMKISRQPAPSSDQFFSLDDDAPPPH
ncbi:hypothetical protein RMATCC62417_06753 [Rhizopus microsporus]|nr:hypothetical protein RMATCC62417_06753 [Rhizopus microsporus]